MLCDSCKQNEAVIHRIVVINGKKSELHLCAQCAKSSGGLTFKLPTFAELMDIAATEPADQDEPACACGMTLSKFRETGLLGCPQCYQTFRTALAPIIEGSQGGRSQHMGTRPAYDAPAQSELDKLREALRAAIETENYEQAAQLRDQIRDMEAKA